MRREERQCTAVVVARKNVEDKREEKDGGGIKLFDGYVGLIILDEGKNLLPGNLGYDISFP